MTRVLAGPVATRFLAGLGAEVLRIDPPDWDEPGVVPEVALGKRCARLDLRDRHGRVTWQALLRTADVLVHGYRPGALDRLGLDESRRAAIRPGLVDVSLDAYGWTGPWRGRRGFDSLVQMSSGIAAEGMRWSGSDRPSPLPVQALDHGAGYLMAAAAIRGLVERRRSGAGSIWRTSLAAVASFLARLPRRNDPVFEPVEADDLSGTVEQTGWGPAKRLRFPTTAGPMSIRWELPARLLGWADATWTN